MRRKTLSFFGQNQYKDWRIILTILFVSFVCAMSFALFSFLYPTKGIDPFSNSNAGARKKINKEVLTTMLSRMEDRQMNFGSLKSSKPIVADPSL